VIGLYSMRLRPFPETSRRSGHPSSNSSPRARRVKRNLRPRITPSTTGTEHGSSRRTFELDYSIESDRTIITGRRCANTWDSDVATFDAVDSVSRLAERESQFNSHLRCCTLDVSSVFHNSFTLSTKIVDDQIHVKDMHSEGDVDMSGATRPPTQHPLLQPTRYGKARS